MSLAALRARVREAVADPARARPYTTATARARTKRDAAVARVADWTVQRERAADIRRDALGHLDALLAQFEERFVAAGGQVWHAADAAHARQIVCDLLRQSGARTAVKAKSMVSEEIHLGPALAQAGIDAIETDLGEFIVQLAGQTPTHITAPAIHLTRQDIGRLFERTLGVAYTEDPAELTGIARRALRQRFLTADAGLTGANFLIAETGEIVLVENEANIRMCITLPRVQIAVCGVEKVIARRVELGPLLTVLSRSATGQDMTAYVSIVGGSGGAPAAGPRKAPGDGAATQPAPAAIRRHVVLLDNGRRQLHADPIRREILACIRCGACLNACPVYERIGGFAYGSAYPGPIGALLGPHGIGAEAREGAQLTFASSLCGACRDACPVRIDIPGLLRQGRERFAEGAAATPRDLTDSNRSRSAGSGSGHERAIGVASAAAQHALPRASRAERWAWRAWSAALGHPRAYRWATRAGRAAARAGGILPASWRRRLPVVGEWCQGRVLPDLPRRSFLEQWEQRQRGRRANAAPPAIPRQARS